MAAGRHINPNQLRMFIPAGELKGYEASPFDRMHPDTLEVRSEKETWNEKLDEATTSGLVKSVRDEGVKKPVAVYHSSEGEGVVTDLDDHGKEVFHKFGPQVIAGGHHRVAAAEFLNPDQLVPVKHYDRSILPGGAPMSGGHTFTPYMLATWENHEEQQA
jgi:hypothetical protein